jgi:SAM-dependent methyltransferase
MEALRRVAMLAQPALSQAGATSLDLGCGTGLFADHVGVRSLIGVDVSDTLLVSARERMETVLQHDIFDLPFAACSTDNIVSLFVIDDYPSEQKAVFFNHVFALLKPGSHCFFAAYAPHDERMGTRRGAITKTAQGGFEVYLDDVPSYQDRLQQCVFLVEQTERITADGFFRVGAQLDELQRAFIVMVGQKP